MVGLVVVVACFGSVLCCMVACCLVRYLLLVGWWCKVWFTVNSVGIVIL